jgi:4'-phosphopantetheinyl transferase
LRATLAHYTECLPEDLYFEIGPHGKPSLREGGAIEFNLSHSGAWAMIAVAHGVPVGVDIERIRPKVDIAALLRRLGESDLPSTIPELFQAWTRREARTKAAGGALFHRPPRCIRALDVMAPHGYAAAIAMVGFEPRVNYCGNR